MKWNSHLIHLPPTHNLLGHVFFHPLSPSFIHGLLALTSHCSSEWHAMLPGIQFIWAMYNHKPYPLQPGRLTQQEPERKKEAEMRFSTKRGPKQPKQTLPLVRKNPPWFLWNTRRDGILYLLKCLQIADAVAECWCSDRWAKRAEKSASRLTEKLGCPTKDWDTAWSKGHLVS